MTDDEIRDSARGMVLSWLAEWALMLRSDQTSDQQGVDAYERVTDRHIDCLLDIRTDMAQRWGWPKPPSPFPFQEAKP